MPILVDTSVLARLANKADPLFRVAEHAVDELHKRGEVLHVTAQNMIEFRNMATRPKGVNGLGLSVAEAATKSAVFETTFPLLVETPDVYPAWKAIADGLGIIGKQVHDARLVAVCHVHSVTHLLTFNVAHFVRFASFGPGIVVVDPAKV
jgi:predicted nucleic acid-binding protein